MSFRNYSSDTTTSSTKAPCKFFAQGICRNGNNCRFSHHINNTQQPSQQSSISNNNPFNVFNSNTQPQSSFQSQPANTLQLSNIFAQSQTQQNPFSQPNTTFGSSFNNNNTTTPTSFGNTAQSVFGIQPNTTFGQSSTSFGTNNVQSSPFGSQQPAFGQSQPPQSSSFGQNTFVQPTVQPTSLFGQSTQTSTFDNINSNTPTNPFAQSTVTQPAFGQQPQSNVFGQSSQITQSAQPTGASTAPIQCTDHKSLAECLQYIKQDFSQVKYPFTCYTHNVHSNQPNLLIGDISVEELRYQYDQATANNQLQQYQQYVNNTANDMMQKRQAILNTPLNTQQSLPSQQQPSAVFGQSHPQSSPFNTQQQSSIFGQSTFGQPQPTSTQQSTFAQSQSNQQPTFGINTNNNTFVSSTPTVTFPQQSQTTFAIQQPTPSTATAFGSTNQPAIATQQPAQTNPFDAPQSSMTPPTNTTQSTDAFNMNSTTQQQPKTVIPQASTSTHPVSTHPITLKRNAAEQMTQQQIDAAFNAVTFKLGFIPEVPPPKQSVPSN